MNKKHIAQSFGKASLTYDKEAPVQHWTAKRLCDFIRDKQFSDAMDCLEIGCGTGFLTQKITNLLPKSKWTITDLSQQMLDQCKNQVGSIGDFDIMDGETPPRHKQYDLIVSSLAVQWFNDLETGLKNLAQILKPGGSIILSTLGQYTFKEWRENLSSLGLPIGLHDYPSLDKLRSFEFEGAKITVQSVKHLQPYDNGLSFLRALKMIGAHKPHTNYKPISSSLLRNAIINLENKSNCSMTYEIFFIEILKDDYV